MLADVMEVKFGRWLIAGVLAVAYSAMAASCAPQPVSAKVSAAREAVIRKEALLRQIEREADALSEVYEKMSDAERMRGVVYEPVGEQK